MSHLERHRRHLHAGPGHRDAGAAESGPGRSCLRLMRTSTTTLRVRYAETDQMGVVYHANYLVWFEVGRTDLLRQLGWTYREMEKTGVRLPVIEVECTYRSPARYDDEIEVRTTGRLLSGVRVEAFANVESPVL